MGIREDLLALAEELDGVSIKDDCDACLASGTSLCRGDLECAESAHKACAKRLREIVEHDAGEVTTVSAYDLLSEEDRKAIAWVRERGGLDAVEKRLMPEGMEWLLEVWPKWSNGEYCKFGDWWTADKYGDCEPKQLRRLCFFTPEQLKEWEQDEGDNYGYEWNFMRPGDTNYRPDKAETPASKILAADGEPLEVGQTVWHVNNGMEFTVSRLPKPGEYQAVEVRYRNGSSTSFDPDQLTHQRPVLDADGVPIKVGDTVWDIETGCGRTIRAVNDNGTVEFDGHENRGWFGRFLTHAKPYLDTWERIEEDARLMPSEYTDRYRVGRIGFESEDMRADLVRRCRALAERGQ